MDQQKGRKPSIVHKKSKDGTQHELEAELRVLVFEERGRWFAQSLEIDYFAEGLTEDELKKNFELGFAETVKLHIKLYGNLKKLVRLAPTPFWEQYFAKVLQSGGVTAKGIARPATKPTFSFQRVPVPLAA